MGIRSGKFQGKIFQIRKINIHQPFQMAQCLRRFIAAGIVYNGKMQPLLFCLLQCNNDLRQKMSRGDEVDIIGPLFLQLQKDFRQMLRSNDSSGLTQSNIMILTKDTSEITAGEKDGSGAGSTGNTGLFPIMQGSSRCHEFSGLPAVPGLTGETVHMAGTWAKHTVEHDVTEPGVGAII